MSSFIENSLKNFIDSGSRCKYPSGLYIVGTPIGNLEDITLRALATLQKMDFIICEDSRVAQKLLNYYGISKPLIVYNDSHGEKTRPLILEHLRQAKRLALVCDAGMPLISDPGYKLVQSILQENIYLTCIPGPSAVITALVLSGLPTDMFHFLGFFPRQPTEALNVLNSFPKESTLIFYESPTRLLKTLTLLEEVDAIDYVVVGRELTKQFEEIIRGSVHDVLNHFETIPPKGEIVLLLRLKSQEISAQEIDHLLLESLQVDPLKTAVLKVYEKTNLSKKNLYQRALSLKNELPKKK